MGSLDFAHAFGALLRAFGPRRLLFGSGLPDGASGPTGARARRATVSRIAVADRYQPFDAAAARAVLGGNAARLYRISVPTPRMVAAAGA